jgi:asparagine synthetase B (glutamine-hydrolysing)
MCGIAGFVDFKKRSSEETLAAMSCAVAHRDLMAREFFIRKSMTLKSVWVIAGFLSLISAMLPTSPCFMVICT